MDSAKYVKAVVASRRDINADLWVIRIRPEEKIAFQAGQYATIALPSDGVSGAPKIVERPYSIASAPSESEMEFFLELVPNGELTPLLHRVAVGGEIALRRSAKGRFTIDAASGHKNHFLVATVTGVAPYLSMVRELAAGEARGEAVPHKLAILQGSSIPIELVYDQDLAARAKSHNWLHYFPTISRPWLDPAWKGEVGRVEDVVRKYLDALGFTPADTTAYLCGNPEMVENVKGVLKRAGFAKEFVKEEIYWVPGKES